MADCHSSGWATLAGGTGLNLAQGSALGGLTAGFGVEGPGGGVFGGRGGGWGLAGGKTSADFHASGWATLAGGAGLNWAHGSVAAMPVDASRVANRNAESLLILLVIGIFVRIFKH
jgi:hypothetical protein